MGKKIAIEESLIDLKNELENMGYDIVDMDNGDVEAIVYMSALVNMNMGFDISNGKGAILINAHGRTADEIDEIIRNRKYSSLF
ncbi:YkuS family protein [Sporanaerobacter acetigenes]|jgi:hypothetical protein|uniref:Uncharacterized protein family (UPF0180) n=1 Tax=Sporanaerobacter acetigenes DSM 13106 TaxID=1123281 RepID=A0A1M5YSD3_9FIRM|nr:YkuS family protein [Sporanaerobacter acetigenes]SHI14915.1 Uncharacterised protein family (UPF0180) [Sporanaerobacter acetigenes DSM 13106]